MEPVYRIVFSGDLASDRRTQEIVESFSARFQVTEDRARSLILSGQRLVLKHDLDRKRAERYRSALEKTGLVVEVEPQDPPLGATMAVEQPPSVEVRHSQSPESEALHSEVQLSETVIGPRLVPPGAPEESPTRAATKPGSADPERCPKCGSRQVSKATGVCQACGVVVERYLARLAAEQEGAANPYAPPQADLTPPAAAQGSEVLRPPRGVSAGRGWGWIGEAWPMFTAYPWTWIGAFMTLMVVSFVLGLIPGVGGVVSTVLGPVFSGGLAIGTHAQYGGGRFDIGSPFAGFTRKPRGLLLLAAAYLGMIAVLVLVTGLGLAAVLGLGDGLDLLVDPQGPDAAQLDRLIQMGPVVLLIFLVGMLLSIPLGMATLFAPYLVALNDVPVPRALALSFLGCWRNILPFLIFGLAGIGLVLASVLTLGIALLVIVPLLIIAIYIAYRDIYYASQRG